MALVEKTVTVSFTLTEAENVFAEAALRQLAAQNSLAHLENCSVRIYPEANRAGSSYFAVVYFAVGDAPIASEEPES